MKRMMMPSPEGFLIGVSFGVFLITMYILYKNVKKNGR
jgi:hypothetical protein